MKEKGTYEWFIIFLKAPIYKEIKSKEPLAEWVFFKSQGTIISVIV